MSDGGPRGGGSVRRRLRRRQRAALVIGFSQWLWPPCRSPPLALGVQKRPSRLPRGFAALPAPAARASPYPPRPPALALQRRTTRRPRLSPREAPVGQDGPVTSGRHAHVLRLDVAVDETLRVGVAERRQDLGEDAARDRLGQDAVRVLGGELGQLGTIDAPARGFGWWGGGFNGVAGAGG